MRHVNAGRWNPASDRQVSMILGGPRLDIPRQRAAVETSLEQADTLFSVAVPEPVIDECGFGRDDRVAWWDTWSL